ncbi:MAG TPA: sugar phosphate isomerase/epimerase [Spirochaetia bacterium]|nr:sugar phosphate isomerase/epimerase [Spirochaetia bacterium]
MRVFYSELCLIGGQVEENVDRLIAQGAENIELMLDGAGWDDFPRRAQSLAAALRAKKTAYSVHVPVWGSNLTYECARYREAVLASYRESLDFAALVGARHVVLHTGSCPDSHFSKEVARSRSRQAMFNLLEYNERYGLLLLVENVGTPATSLFTQEQFASFLEGMPDAIGYIVDVGHAHISGWDLEALFAALGGRLHALHLHDNDGTKDAHAPIGTGSVDWDRLLAAAAASASASGNDLGLVLEYNIGTDLSTLAAGKAALERAWRGGSVRA